MSEFDDAAAALSDASERGDRLAAWQAAGRLAFNLSNLVNPLPGGLRQLVWSNAIRKRWFDIAEIVLSAAAARADATPGIRRLQAHMLLERGFTEEALARLDQVLADPGLSPKDREEALGHIGRIYKDRFVGNGDRASLKRALDAYGSGTSAWHEINAVALLSRPEAESIEPGAAHRARRIAAEIAAKVDPASDEYAKATLAEASLATGDIAGLLTHLRGYLGDARVTPFQLGALLRQFREVWRLDQQPKPGPEIVAMISSALLEREGAVLRLSDQELQRAVKMDFQAVFGADRFDSFENYRRGLERCSCVARIGRTADTGVGTGFVIPGKLLSARLGEEFVLLTNAHVISENDAEIQAGALHRSEAVITFAAMDGVAPEKEFGIATIHFASPREELDVCVASLTAPVAPKQAYPMAQVLPAAGSNAQVRVIGHPSGRGLSLSVNQLLDHQAPKLHYKTATEGGSSGSPVFNQDWRLIGIHHAGGEAVPRLNGQAGTYQANEGIWIKAIANAIG